MIRRLGIAAVSLGAIVAGSLAGYTLSLARRVERAMPPRGHFIDMDGNLIHYLDEGSGPPIVMIHGLGGQMGNFTHSLVERLTGEYRVIVMERPGSGYSKRLRGASARLRHQAEIVAKFIDAMHLDRPLVVGHSLGGAVSLALALDHPEKTRGLALIAPLTHARERTPAPFQALRIRSPLLRMLVAWTLAAPLSRFRREFVLDFLFSPNTVPHDYATKGGGYLNLRPSSFFGASTDLVVANEDLPGMVERYPTLGLPIAMLFGKGDRILDYRHHAMTMKDAVPAMALELIEGGHMLPLSAPDEAAEMIRRLARQVYSEGETFAPESR